MPNKKVEHVTLNLKSLHWLPVCQRIDFKLLMFSGLHISEKRIHDEAFRPLRSSRRADSVFPGSKLKQLLVSMLNT